MRWPAAGQAGVGDPNGAVSMRRSNKVDGDETIQGAKIERGPEAIFASLSGGRRGRAARVVEHALAAPAGRVRRGVRADGVRDPGRLPTHAALHRRGPRHDRPGQGRGGQIWVQLEYLEQLSQLLS